jgi:hypothetical protein
MLGKKGGGYLIGGLMIFLMAGPVAAQLADVSKFKGIQIPYTLKHEDKVLEKGRYDLEVVKERNSPTYYLMFKKKGKVVCLVKGEQLTVEVRAGARLTDASIPDSPRLKIKKDTAEKILIFTVETGRHSRSPFQLLKFKLGYEDEE